MAKPRGTRPGASTESNCQRAGTVSGVVVMPARFMGSTIAARHGGTQGIRRRAALGAGGGKSVEPWPWGSSHTLVLLSAGRSPGQE